MRTLQSFCSLEAKINDHHEEKKNKERKVYDVDEPYAQYNACRRDQIGEVR